MCETNKEVKFCTCDDIKEADWKLTRVTTVRSIPSMILGSWRQDEKDTDEKKLDENTLFDIKDYTPEEGDVLEDYGLAIYHYKNKNWKRDSTYHPFGNHIHIQSKEKSKTYQGKIE